MLEVLEWPPAMAAEYVLTMLRYHLDLTDEARQLAATLNMHVSKA